MDSQSRLSNFKHARRTSIQEDYERHSGHAGGGESENVRLCRPTQQKDLLMHAAAVMSASRALFAADNLSSIFGLGRVIGVFGK